MSLSTSVSGYGSISVDLSVYPYQVGVAGLGLSGLGGMGLSLWYGWLALVLVLVGGLLGIVGSVKTSKVKMLTYGGALALVSIIIFVVGLQLDFLSTTSTAGLTLTLFGLFVLRLLDSIGCSNIDVRRLKEEACCSGCGSSAPSAFSCVLANLKFPIIFFR